MALDDGHRTSGSIDLNESDSLDMNAVNKLFQDVYAEEKQSTIGEEGTSALPTKPKTAKYHRTRTLSGHDASNHPESRHSQSPSQNHSAVPAKAYCVAGYHILLHLLLIYCVMGVTYLLLMHTNQINNTAHCQCTEVRADSGSSDLYTTYNNHTASCECTGTVTAAPSESPSEFPTKLPTKFPSANPTKIPSGNPTKLPTEMPTLSPTKRPTAVPTKRPTLQPTNRIESYVGDYKISARNISHGAWRLCDGSFVDSVDYPELFEVIGNSFGSFSGYPSLFRLPDGRGNVLGVKNDEYDMGVHIGKSNITLTEDNLPSHYHLLIGASGCRGYNSLNAANYLSIDCNYQNGDNFHIAAASSTSATKGRSSSVGNNEPINVFQPTLYVGNLFIYTGRI